MTKCIGLFGRIFGHKFKFTLGDYEYDSDHCRRCGTPKGGVNVAPFLRWWTRPTSYLSGEVPMELVKTDPQRVLTAARRFMTQDLG